MSSSDGSFVRRSLAAVVLGCCLSSCDSAYVGSDVLWSAEHETGDLSEWLRDNAGAAEVDTDDGSVAVSDAFAHTGRYSVKLEKIVAGTPARGAGPRLIRYANLPKHAFYSAWFLIPEAYATGSYWTILQFDSSAAESSVEDRGVNLQLRTLPDGNGLVLQVIFHLSAYLAAPLANPPPRVPIGRWFHLEAEFEASVEATGGLVVWLDGERIYDLRQRSTVDPETLEFLVASMLVDASPSPVTLYVDDVVISRSRTGAH
ncbi:MAG TPA: hypothetical protein VFQ35_25290 [Polyangiaceae bacterium]|nr:hypothetical protein [Polyangiaceae bacterium]